MVKEELIPTWEEFENRVESILQEVKERRAKTGMYVSEPLFRGLSVGSWKLDTTLERLGKRDCGVAEYTRIMRNVKPLVESLTDKRWDLDKEDEMNHSQLPPPSYAFMIYLRHHGFPSPILDWTRSPYIAAHFAFRPKPSHENENVAIYSYIQHYGYGTTSRGQYSICCIGPTITTDRRHHIQQCEYTFVTTKKDNKLVYSSHEDALSEEAMVPQDSLTKYLIPTSERAKVLAKLDFMNINSFSLFADENGLMDLLSYRDIERVMS